MMRIRTARSLSLALMLLLVGAGTADAAKKRPRRGPINARLGLAPGRAVSALITAAGGGTITVSAGKHATMTITFPPGAVVEDTKVTATPVTRLTAPKLRPGLLAGVQLQPEGLSLARAARVRFARHGKARRGRHLVFVGTQGSGKDLYRVPPRTHVRGKGRNARVVATASPVVSIVHFSTIDGFDWSNATIDEIDAINRPALGIDAVSQEVSELIKHGATTAEIAAVFDRARARFVEPLLANASEAVTQRCSEGAVRRAQTALQVATAFERQMQMTASDIGVSVPAMVELLQQSATCMTALCPRLGDPRVGFHFVALARQFQLLGIASNDAFYETLIGNMVKCGTFEVHLDSRIDDAFNGQNFTMQVEARVKVTPSLEQTPPPPRGPLTYVKTAGASQSVCGTTTISATKPGVLEIAKVTFSAYDPDRPTQNPVLALKLAVPTQPSETYHTTATGAPNCGTHVPPDYDAPLWFYGLQAEHPGFDFTGVDFVRDAAPKFATAVYSPRTISFGNGSVSENTLIEIIHRPEQPTPLPPADAG